MRALVTGASGFAGRALTAHLRAVGDEVIGWSRSAGNPDVTDRPAVLAAVPSCKPDVIYHLAAQSHVPTAWDDPVTTLRVNVEGTQNIVDAAATIENVRVVVVTSGEIYGSTTVGEPPITEKYSFRPTNPYAASKAAADAIASSAYLGRGLDVVRVRPFNHIGPGQSTDFVAAGFAHRIVTAIAAGRDTIDVGQLDARRDFCDVRDIATAYRQAAVLGEPGAAYNVCSGVDRSIHDLAQALITVSGAHIELRESDELKRPGAATCLVGSAASFADRTGWIPEIPFDQSMRDIYQDAVERAGSSKETP